MLLGSRAMAASGNQWQLDHAMYSCSLLCGIDQAARMTDAAGAELSDVCAGSELGFGALQGDDA